LPQEATPGRRAGKPKCKIINVKCKNIAERSYSMGERLESQNVK